MSSKVVFVGNCQAQAFQSLSGHLRLGVDVLVMPPVWKITDADKDDLEEQLQRADVIFSQRVSEDFPATFLRNAELRRKYGNKVVVWPNIYFDGYFPGIKYIYGSDGKLEGPLLDYHFEWLFRGWAEGASIDEVASLSRSLSKWQYAKNFVEISLLELMRREKQVDVGISDYIVANFRDKKLFHSMNHPDTSVLVEMMRRLFSFAGLDFKRADYATYRYHLNQIEVPEFDIFRDRYKPLFRTENAFKGVGLDKETNKPTDEVVYYDLEALIRTYFGLYERVRSKIK